MKRHWNIEIKSVVVAHVGHKEHDNESHIISHGYDRFDSEELGREEETMSSDEKELRESNQMAGSRIVSKIRKEVSDTL